MHFENPYQSRFVFWNKMILNLRAVSLNSAKLRKAVEVSISPVSTMLFYKTDFPSFG